MVVIAGQLPAVPGPRFLQFLAAECVFLSDVHLSWLVLSSVGHSKPASPMFHFDLLLPRFLAGETIEK